MGHTRKAGKILAAGAVIVAGFGALQLAPAPPRTNPAPHPGWSLQESQSVPKDVMGILDRACMNCHSDQTKWPWYSAVAPGSWLVRRDVERARQSMNFSEWRNPTEPWPEMPVARLAAVCAAVQQDAMPPASYRALHPEARLSQADKSALCEWTNAGMLALTSRRRVQGDLRP